MAFETAGEDHGKKKYDGIPMAWENLEHNCCPRCGDEMREFDHIRMWKCFCGFNISCGKRNDIVDSIREGGEFGTNSGYGYGNYHDHPPFN